MTLTAGHKDDPIIAQLVGANHVAPDVSIFGDFITGQRLTDIQLQFTYNAINSNTRNLTAGTGAVTQAAAMAALSTGAGIGHAQLTSHDAILYRAGHEAWGIFTAVFTTPDAGSSQHIGPHDDENGWWVGYEGENFCFGYIRGGVAECFDITDSSLVGHIDALDGKGPSHFTIDPTKTNLYRIRYGFLGIAPAVLEVYAGWRKGWVPVHVLDLSNRVSTTHILNPNLPLRADAQRTSGTGAIIVKTASWQAGTVGDDSNRAGNRHFTVTNTKVVGAALTNLLSVRSKLTYPTAAPVTNHIRAFLEFLSVSAEGSKNIELFLVENATLGGTPSWADVDAVNSVMEKDVAGTTVTGGDVIIPLEVAKTGHILYQSGDKDILLHPGDMWTLAASVSASTSEVKAAIHWNERF